MSMSWPPGRIAFPVEADAPGSEARPSARRVLDHRPADPDDLDRRDDDQGDADRRLHWAPHLRRGPAARPPRMMGRADGPCKAIAHDEIARQPRRGRSWRRGTSDVSSLATSIGFAPSVSSSRNTSSRSWWQSSTMTRGRPSPFASSARRAAVSDS